MDANFIYFLLGALISIPISVLSPFATAKLQQHLGVRHRRSAPRRRSTILRELEQITAYQDFARFSVFLLGRVLFITMISTLLYILPTLLQGVSSLVISDVSTDYAASTQNYATSQSIEAAAMFVYVVGYSIVVQLCVRTLRILNRVTHYDDYVRNAEAQLSSLGQSVVGGEIRPGQPPRPPQPWVPVADRYRYVPQPTEMIPRPRSPRGQARRSPQDINEPSAAAKAALNEARRRRLAEAEASRAAPPHVRGDA